MWVQNCDKFGVWTVHRPQHDRALRRCFCRAKHFCLSSSLSLSYASNSSSVRTSQPVKSRVDRYGPGLRPSIRYSRRLVMNIVVSRIFNIICKANSVSSARTRSRVTSSVLTIGSTQCGILNCGELVHIGVSYASVSSLLPILLPFFQQERPGLLLISPSS